MNGNSKLGNMFMRWWGRLDLNQGPIGYACHFNFRCLFRVRGLDCLFVRQLVDACHSVSTPFRRRRTWLGIAVFKLRFPRI